MPPELAIDLGGLRLRNPIVCGSGEHTMTYDGLVAALDAGAAAVVAKSANESPEARRQLDSAEYVLLDEHWAPLPFGPASRSASLLNRSGLVRTAFPEWLETLVRADAYARACDAYVVASLIPGDPDELPGLASAVEQAGLRWLELNLSAPHAGEATPGAIGRADSDTATRELTASVRAAVGIHLTVKLTGDGADAAALAGAAHDAGADSIALAGRHLAFLPDPDTRRPVLGTFAAIGGAWSLPLTLRWIAKTRLAAGPGLPLVGTNGARDGRDVVRFLLAGASAVELASAVFVEGPAALTRIRNELTAHLEAQGLDAADIVGEAADAALTYEEAAMRNRT